MRPTPLPTILLALALGTVVLVTAAALRDPEYDEGYTAFVTSAEPRPDWPATPFRAGDMRAAFAPAPAPWAIAGNLRRTDVHPPLYFWTVWAWRRFWGPALLPTRMLSVGFSLGALAAVAAIAAEARFPVTTSLALTLGCYGFVETGIVARGYAMAQCLLMVGLLLTLKAAPPHAASRFRLFSAGLALGAACFANYLAAFPAAAAVLWSLSRRPRGVAPLLAGWLPFVMADLFFFLAERSSRPGQFPDFTWIGMTRGMAHAVGGAILGGLPLYVTEGPPRIVTTGLLGLVLLAMLVLPVLRWRHLPRGGPRSLLALAVIATPLGLLLMGLASRTAPVEIRYVAFALPPFALLLAASLRSLPPLWGRVAPGALLALLAASIAGLMTRPETMQPEGAAARAAFRAVGDNGLVLLPRGNDGVGVVSAFLTAAPDGLHVLLVGPSSRVPALRQILLGWQPVAAAEIDADRDSRAAVPLMMEALRRDRQMR